MNYWHEDEVWVWLIYRVFDPKIRAVSGLTTGGLLGMGMSRVEVDPSAENVGEVPEGEVPEWYEMNLTWAELLDMDVRVCGYWDLVDWGMRRGIVPGQPFFVRLARTTSAGPAEILAKAPISPEAVQAAWDEAFREATAATEGYVLDLEHRASVLQHDRTHMLVIPARYSTPRDHAGVASGLRLDLMNLDPSDPESRVRICEGNDDAGSYERALERLLANAAWGLPHLPPEFIRGLSGRPAR